MFSKETIIIIFLVTLIIVKSAAQGILIPILTEYYDSLYFILIFNSFQFVVIFGVIYLFVTRGKLFIPSHKKLIVLCGFFNGLMAISMLYAANPKRTPVVIQAILAGLPVIPSLFLRKLMIRKIIVYDKKFIISSVIILFICLGILIIPLVSGFEIKNLIWICLFIFGIFCMSIYNVIQEKYIIETEDYSLKNKLTIIFYSRVIELIVNLSFCWLDKFIGYDNDPVLEFKNSIYQFCYDYRSALLLESFVIAFLISYVAGIYLNSISTNYNMLTPAVANPIVALFFTIFPYFNSGIKYPIWMVIICIILSVVSIILWIRGEKKITDYQLINEFSNSKIFTFRTHGSNNYHNSIEYSNI